MKRTPVQWCGLLGIISLFSYAAAVLFSPLAYPGYQWMSQAVSDLSASNAPSKVLWGQLASLYDICGITSVMMVCVFIQGKLNRTIRIGIYLFAAMNWVSAIGYAAFPLSAQGNAGTAFQDIMHVYVVTALVVLLSVLSLILIMAGGYQDRRYRYLAGWATAALLFMLAGAVGTGIVPAAYFGIPERFSVFAAAGFNAVLGVCLYRGFN